MARTDTRTYHAPGAAPAPPAVEQVRDPGSRAIWLVVARALGMIVAEIQRRCGGGQEPPDPP